MSGKLILVWKDGLVFKLLDWDLGDQGPISDSATNSLRDFWQLTWPLYDLVPHL